MFQLYRPRQDLRPIEARAPQVEGAVRLRWLGTAGHVIETARTTVLVDPFLTRPSLLRTAFTRLEPAPDRWWRHLPARVDAICLGHSHYDHLMDAPSIALRTSAKVIGSETTGHVARASGVPEAQIITVPTAGLELTVGDVQIRFVPSLHARLLAGKVPFPGVLDGAPRLPARVWDYKMGGAFGVVIRAGGRTFYHNGSADLVDRELNGLHADVLLVGLAGRKATRDYVHRLVAELEPSVVLPTHHDAFFAPLEDGVHLLPGVDLDGFEQELARAAPDARLVTPLYEDTLFVPVDGEVRESVITTATH